MGAACYVGWYCDVDTVGDVYVVTVEVGWVWSSDDCLTVPVVPVRCGGYYSVEYGVHYVSCTLSIAVAGIPRGSRVASVVGVVVPSV